MQAPPRLFEQQRHSHYAPCICLHVTHPHHTGIALSRKHTQALPLPKASDSGPLACKTPVRAGESRTCLSRRRVVRLLPFRVFCREFKWTKRVWAGVVLVCVFPNSVWGVSALCSQNIPQVLL